MKDTVKICKGDNTYDLHVMWSIHNKCNYECSYCPSELHDGEWQWLNLERIKKFIDKIENHYVHRLGFKNILFSFTGGEPTLWKDFKPFIQYIDKKGFRCGVTTNGSVSPGFWSNISHAFDYICLSFHPEKAEETRFLENYKFLHDEIKTVIPSIRVMMHKDHKLWLKSISLIEKLRTFPNWSYQAVHVLKNYGMGSEKIDYGSKTKNEFLSEHAFQEQFKDNSVIKIPSVSFNYNIQDNQGKIEKLNENELINNDNVDFLGWNCHIGIEELFIHFSGIVKTSGCGSASEIGNILEHEKIRFPTKPTICKDKGCYCPTDIRITKSPPSSELDYKISDDTSTLCKIGDNNSFFKYRIFLNISDFTFTRYTPESYTNYLNMLTLYICENKSISPQQICIHITTEPKFDLKNTPNFFKELSNLTAYKALVTPVNNFTKIDREVIATSIDYVQVKVKNLKALAIATQLLKVVQENKNQRLIIDIFKDKSFDLEVYQLIKLAIKKYDYYEFVLHDFKEGDISYNLIEQNGSRFIGKIKNHVDVITRCSKANSFVYDEVTSFENTRQSTLIADNNLHTNTSFTGWKCQQGSNFISIRSDGEIETSLCAQSFSIGNIQSINESFDFNSSVICKQKICSNTMNRLIHKEVK